MYYRRGSVSAGRRRSVVDTTSDEQRRAYNDPTLADGIYGSSNLVMPESLMLLRRHQPSRREWCYTRQGLDGWPARGAQKRSGAELWAVLRECVHDRLNLGTNLLGLSFGPNKLRWKRDQMSTGWPWWKVAAWGRRGSLGPSLTHVPTVQLQ